MMLVAGMASVEGVRRTDGAGVDWTNRSHDRRLIDQHGEVSMTQRTAGRGRKYGHLRSPHILAIVLRPHATALEAHVGTHRRHNAAEYPCSSLHAHRLRVLEVDQPFQHRHV